MKPRLIVSYMLLYAVTTWANGPVRSTGIGFRGSLWDGKGQNARVTVDNGLASTEVNAGGGGSLFLFSRTSDNTFIEITLGSYGVAETRQTTWHRENVDVNAVTHATVGLKQELFSLHNPSSLRPYVAVGAGPYWIHTVAVQTDGPDEHVAVNSKGRKGGYLGGGFNFMLDNWLGVNMDCRYHFVSFDKNHEFSGLEYGLGLVFMWGRY
jgi:outer membrane protein W